MTRFSYILGPIWRLHSLIVRRAPPKFVVRRAPPKLVVLKMFESLISRLI